MKKILICLIAIASLCLFVPVSADDSKVIDMNVTIVEEGDEIYVTIPDGIDSMTNKPTMKVNTDKTKNFIVYGPSNELIEFNTSSGVTSFKVTTSGTYTIKEKLDVNVTVDYKEKTVTSLKNINKEGIKLNGKSFDPSNISSFDLTVNNTIMSDSNSSTIMSLNTSINNKEGSSNVDSIYYLDIDCKINGNNVTSFGSGNDELIPVEFNLPLTIDSSTQELKLYRIHDGVVKELPITSFANGVVKFNSSYFSTYAFVVVNKTAASNGGGGGGYYKLPVTGID